MPHFIYWFRKSNYPIGKEKALCMAGRRVDRNATGTGRFKPIVSKPAFKSHHTSHLEDASFQPGLYTFLFSSLRVTQSHGPHSSFILFFIYFFLNRPHVLYFVFIYILLSIYFSFPPHLTLLTLPPPQCCRSHRWRSCWSFPLQYIFRRLWHPEISLRLVRHRHFGTARNAPGRRGLRCQRVRTTLLSFT